FRLGSRFVRRLRGLDVDEPQLRLLELLFSLRSRNLLQLFQALLYMKLDDPLDDDGTQPAQFVLVVNLNLLEFFGGAIDSRGFDGDVRVELRQQAGEVRADDPIEEHEQARKVGGRVAGGIDARLEHNVRLRALGLLEIICFRNTNTICYAIC